MHPSCGGAFFTLCHITRRSRVILGVRLQTVNSMTTRNPHVIRRSVLWGLLALVGAAGTLFGLRAIYWYVFRISDISELPVGQPYSDTRFEFRYGNQHRVVEDPSNRMRWVFGELPDEISVVDGIRLIV